MALFLGLFRLPRSSLDDQTVAETLGRIFRDQPAGPFDFPRPNWPQVPKDSVAEPPDGLPRLSALLPGHGRSRVAHRYFAGIIIKYLLISIYYDKHPGESLIIDGLLKEADRILKIQSGVSFSTKEFLLLSDRIIWFNIFQKKFYGIILFLVILDQKN